MTMADAFNVMSHCVTFCVMVFGCLAICAFFTVLTCAPIWLLVCWASDPPKWLRELLRRGDD